MCAGRAAGRSLARYIEAGDWRNPERVCYRPPVRYGNRLVD